MEQFKTATGTTNPPGVTTASETCAHCGQPLGGHRGIEDFLAKVGITPDMIHELRTSMQNADIEEYLNTAREYLRTAGDKVKTSSDKAKIYTKENPGKVAAGVAILAVGAGLLINAINHRDR